MSQSLIAPLNTSAIRKEGAVSSKGASFQQTASDWNHTWSSTFFNWPFVKFWTFPIKRPDPNSLKESESAAAMNEEGHAQNISTYSKMIQ